MRYEQIAAVCGLRNVRAGVAVGMLLIRAGRSRAEPPSPRGS